ncbi:MAG: alpha/beta hydrolase, partial [Myxococcota bacterium]
PVPTLVIQNTNDPWANVERVQQYFDELQVEKEIRWPELSKDRAAAYDWLGTHPEQLVAFFDTYM